uniref:Uncharacterized protein n=1 Tax=Romanomermis culicivorax TaxID=13658 RepID=A0A915K406_ROMCU
MSLTERVLREAYVAPLRFALSLKDRCPVCHILKIIQMPREEVSQPCPSFFFKYLFDLQCRKLVMLLEDLEGGPKPLALKDLLAEERLTSIQ